MQFGKIGTRLAAHFTKGHQRLGAEIGRRHAIDHVDHRNVLAADFLDDVVESVERNRANHDGIRTGCHAVFDLRDLVVQFGIAAGLDQLHLDAQALGLFSNAVIDAEPVSVFHMREGDADLPRFRRFLQWRVVHGRARAGHVEGRIPDLHRIGIPVLGLGLRHGNSAERGRTEQCENELVHVFDFPCWVLADRSMRGSGTPLAPGRL